jgi:2-phosphosulfolactate phosphatase
MRLETYFTVREVDPSHIDNATVVVIDVVRATTTILEALASGARTIFPTESTEEAVKLAASLGREDTILCGERRGAKIDGFDLGNSPREYLPHVVEGKKLVMSTTNGTRALRAAQEGGRVVLCAFTNLAAVARHVSEDDHVVILCAGQEDRFSLDDALCAGHLILRLLERLGEEPELDDASRAAGALASVRKPSEGLLRLTAAGISVIEIGLGDDLQLCSEVDRHDIVAEMSDQAITRTEA